jgi:phytoene synthase
MGSVKMVHPVIRSIFKKGSRTYFYSSLFFPPAIRDDVFRLYAFVRKADDFVDSTPQQSSEFYAFKEKYENALDGIPSGDIVIDEFTKISLRKNFDSNWVEAFLWSMESDLYINRYDTEDALRVYLYGSAEVVGLMMAKIMDLPEEAYPSARALGRAMQYANFIRDISEDLELGRIYFPMPELYERGLTGLEYEQVSEKPEAFKDLIYTQLDRFTEWQAEAEAGFSFIPRRYRIPIKTASEMYKWTAKVIRRNPMIVYDVKVKPSIPRIVSSISINSLASIR